MPCFPTEPARLSDVGPSIDNSAPGSGQHAIGADTRGPIEVTRIGRVATVTLHGTGAGNALGGAVFRQLPEVFRDLAEDASVHAVILRGAAATFSVGLDLRWYLPTYRRMMRNGERSARQALADQTRDLQAAGNAVAACPVPVLAAISGACVGAALELVAACDIRIASAQAVFTAAEADIGVVADLGLLQRLPRLVGEGGTAYLAFTGDPVTADQALRLGLIQAVHPDPQALYRAASALAARICRHDRHVLGGIKQVLHLSRDLPVDKGLAVSALWTAAFMPGPDLMDRLRQRLAGPGDEEGGNA